MGCGTTPETWSQWFREGTIDETEFYHGLIACAIVAPLPGVVHVLRDPERAPFEAQLRQLVDLSRIVPGQMVRSVARYCIDDVPAVLAQWEAMGSKDSGIGTA